MDRIEATSVLQACRTLIEQGCHLLPEEKVLRQQAWDVLSPPTPTQPRRACTGGHTFPGHVCEADTPEPPTSRTETLTLRPTEHPHCFVHPQGCTPATHVLTVDDLCTPDVPALHAHHLQTLLGMLALDGPEITTEQAIAIEAVLQHLGAL